MKFEIQDRRDGRIIYTGEGETIAEVIESAVKAGVSLNYADLHGADLNGANLNGADLNGANLHGANLRGADLHGANLHGAYLNYAKLRGADLNGADLHGANLNYAKLNGANLNYAKLNGANLNYAKLNGAKLNGAYLHGAYLHGAYLHGADLNGKTVLPTGETWNVYLKDVLPELLRAGGKEVAEVAKHWKCHDWNNCPMAVAFGVACEQDTPILLRPRVRQFVQLFDANVIPCPAVK